MSFQIPHLIIFADGDPSGAGALLADLQQVSDGALVVLAVLGDASALLGTEARVFVRSALGATQFAKLEQRQVLFLS